MYAPIVIEPAKGERYKVARDYVVMLSDHHPMSPGAILRKLKQEPGYFNDRKRTLPGLLRDLRAAKTTEERQAIISDRLMWGEMRMDPTDLADVTGYTFLVNGRGPTDNWTGLFKPGEKVRLRFINGSAMTIFDARIPGLQAQGRAGRRQRRAAGRRRRVPDRRRRDLRRDRRAAARTAPTRSRRSRSTAAASPAPPWRRARAWRARCRCCGRPACSALADMGHGGMAAAGWIMRRWTMPRWATRRDGSRHVGPGPRAAGRCAGRHEGAGLCRPQAPRSRLCAQPARPHDRDPADRQHGEVHLVVRRPQIFRAAGDATSPRARRCGWSSRTRP